MKYAPLSLLLLLLFSCKDDICTETIDLGNFPLSTEAKSFIPYSASTRTAIFKDELGAEFPFIIQNAELFSNLGTNVPWPCPDDEDQMISHVSTTEGYRINVDGVIRNNERVLFNLWMNPVVQPNGFGIKGEELIILCWTATDTSACLYHRIDQVDEQGDEISHEDNTDILSSVDLLDKSFNEVIVNNGMGFDSDSRVAIFYNKEQGIVGFRDEQENVTYALERIE